MRLAGVAGTERRGGTWTTIHSLERLLKDKTHDASSRFVVIISHGKY